VNRVRLPVHVSNSVSAAVILPCWSRAKRTTSAPRCERVAVGLLVDKVQQDCAASPTRDRVDDVVGVHGVSVGVGNDCSLRRSDLKIVGTALDRFECGRFSIGEQLSKLLVRDGVGICGDSRLISPSLPGSRTDW